MYTVIVADDEEEIRRGIIKKVKWEELGFQVIGEAANGAESPSNGPATQPKVAPMKKEGTISPPLKPAPKVSAVKIILSRNASAFASPCNACVMIFMPAPL